MNLQVNSPLRVGISSNTIEPVVNNGHIDGIGIYTQNLLANLPLSSCKTVPIFYGGLRTWHLHPSLPESIKIISPYLTTSFMGIISPSLSTFLTKNIERNIDLLHVTDYRIPRLRNTPVIATLYDAIMLKHPEWCNPKHRRLKNWLLKQTAQWADRIIAISYSIVPDLIEYWQVDEKKIDVVHCGIADEWFERIDKEKQMHVLDKFNLQPGFLLSVGTLQPRKNVEKIIEAYNLLPDDLQRNHKLVLVGKNGWRSDSLLQKIETLIGNGKGIWLQYVNADELKALYQSARLFLFPSLAEGFGLPILEAFASEIPVITSNISVMSEIAGDSAYLIDPYSIAELQTAMQRLLTDKQLREVYIHRGKERVKQFSWLKCAEKTLAVYEKVL